MSTHLQQHWKMVICKRYLQRAIVSKPNFNLLHLREPIPRYNLDLEHSPQDLILPETIPHHPAFRWSTAHQSCTLTTAQPQLFRLPPVFYHFSYPYTKTNVPLPLFLGPLLYSHRFHSRRLFSIHPLSPFLAIFHHTLP